jgi:hypothetical protein
MPAKGFIRTLRNETPDCDRTEYPIPHRGDPMPYTATFEAVKKYMVPHPEETQLACVNLRKVMREAGCISLPDAHEKVQALLKLGKLSALRIDGNIATLALTEDTEPKPALLKKQPARVKKKKEVSIHDPRTDPRKGDIIQKGEPHLHREVTGRDGETVYYRRPLGKNPGDEIALNLPAWQRWCKGVENVRLG